MSQSFGLCGCIRGGGGTDVVQIQQEKRMCYCKEVILQICKCIKTTKENAMKITASPCFFLINWRKSKLSFHVLPVYAWVLSRKTPGCLPPTVQKHAC